jgi:hypothetical protein
MMKTKVFAIFFLALLVLTACGPQTVSPSGFSGNNQAWIDAPLPGSHLPLAEVEIVAHSANPGGIASFEISLNGQLLARTGPEIGSIDPSLVYTRYPWLPAAPGTYLIEVKAIDTNDQPSFPVQVVVEVGDPTPTETITQVPTPTLTLTPTCGPLTFTTNINAYCRQGPGVVFPALEELAMKGQPFLMDGRNSDGSWYRIMLTPAKGCWVPAGVGTPSCDPGNLRVLIDIPTPVISCSVFTDRATCESNDPLCKWNLALAGPGVCVNK